MRVPFHKTAAIRPPSSFYRDDIQWFRSLSLQATLLLPSWTRFGNFPSCSILQMVLLLSPISSATAPNLRNFSCCNATAAPIAALPSAYNMSLIILLAAVAVNSVLLCQSLFFTFQDAPIGMTNALSGWRPGSMLALAVRRVSCSIFSRAQASPVLHQVRAGGPCRIL